MKYVLEKLAELSDQLDKIEDVELADELDLLIKEVADKAKEEEELSGICPACEGTGEGITSPWCGICKGTGKGKREATKKASLKLAVVKHEDGKWIVYSKKGKKLGTYKTKSQAEKRLKQIEMFKHMK